MSPILERRRVPALICAWLALALAGAAVSATDAGAAAWHRRSRSRDLSRRPAASTSPPVPTAP